MWSILSKLKTYTQMLFTLFVYSTIKVMFLFSELESIDFHVDSQGMNSTSPFVTLM